MKDADGMYGVGTQTREPGKPNQARLVHMQFYSVNTQREKHSLQRYSVSINNLHNPMLSEIRND